jgi:DNA-binding transcriptional regulator YiaG
MNHAEFKAIRERAGLTQSGLAAFLRISDKRTVRYWETGERPITGPVSLLMELLDAGSIRPE